MNRCILSICVAALIATSCSEHANRGLSSIPTPAKVNSSLPFLTSDRSGNVVLSWVEPAADNNTYALKYAALKNDSWSNSQTIASAESWFINWADFPSVVAKNGVPVAAHALNKKPGGTYAYDVNLYLNQEKSRWSAPITPHFDSTATEHGFVSLATHGDSVLAIWLDGRRSANRSDAEYFDIDKAMTLRSAVIGADGSINTKRLIDPSVCDCCNTAITQTENGIIAAYRNRTNDEVRDIYVSRFDDESWSKPRAVHNDNWKIAACPVNGPAIASAGSRVAVAWYTAAQGNQVVKVAISDDNGKTFSSPVTVSDNTPIGRVNVAAENNGNFFVSWMERTGESALLKLKTITPDGKAAEEITVSKMDASRESGFPQMVASDGRLIFAWTQVDNTTTVKTSSLPVKF